MIDIDWYESGNKFYGPIKIEGKDKIPSFVVFSNSITGADIELRAITITFGLYSNVGDQELECKSPEEGGYTDGDAHRKFLNHLMNKLDYDRKMIMSVFNKNEYAVYF